jgi:hypothetical protein
MNPRTCRFHSDIYFSSHLTSSQPSNNGFQKCAGIDIDSWPQDIVFSKTFPFHRARILTDEGDLPFDIEIRERGKSVFAYSKACDGRPTIFAPRCHQCQGLSPRLKELGDMAKEVLAGTNYKYFSHGQLVDLLLQRNEELNKLKLDVRLFVFFTALCA